MSINNLLFTVKDTLTANQMALSVIGANIANVNTPGYSRQRADMVAVGDVSIKGLGAQFGVDVQQVSRIYDRYIESQLLLQQQTTAYSDGMLQSLQNIETILDDTNGGGINAQLDRFWASWEDLANNPSGKLERNALLSTAESLVGAIGSYKQSLDSVNTELNRSIADTVPLINDKIREIADLTAQVIEAGKNTGELNDILDKRTIAFQELGSMINISYFETSNGTLNVYLANGEPLMQGAISQTLSFSISNGKTDIYSTNSPNTINDAITSGKLGAYMELQHKILPGYIDDLNNMTSALAARVNALHSSGFDADGNMGMDFFSITNPANPASSVSVNPVIGADINRIAASASVLGDGENATRLAAVRDEFLMDGGKQTLSDFLATMVGEIGRQTANAKTNDSHQATIMNYLTNQRESVSGVSIDEEMILLTQYQMGYAAAGKLSTMVNEMLDILMSIIE
jgi:flagellar hook-associated protein 1 FlgK